MSEAAGTTADRPARLLTALVWGAVVALTLLPAMRAQIPIGADMANHLARVHILHHLPDDAVLQRFYQADWRVLPNLAYDAVMLPLLQVLESFAAGRLFVALSLLMMFAGVAALRRQLTGRVGWMPLGVAIIAYNPPLAVGMAGFTFGLGALLLALAGWFATAAWRPWWRLAVLSAVATGLFFVHAMIATAYGLVLAAAWLDDTLRDGRPDWPAAVPLMGQFAAPAALWILVPPPSHGTETLFGPAQARLEAALSPVLYFQDFDMAAGAALALLLAWLLISRRLTMARPMTGPVLVLVAASLLMPMQLLGVWLTHVRLPVVAALLFLAAAQVRLPEQALRGAVIAALVLVGLLRLEKVDAAISHCDAKRGEIIAAVAPLPRGVRLLTVMQPGSRTGDCLFSNYWHMPALAVITRSAFYPQMFVHMQPIALKPAVRHLSQRQQQPAEPGYLAPGAAPGGTWGRTVANRWRRDFDVLVWLHPETSPGPVPDGVTRLGGGAFFTLYRIGADP